MRSRAERRKFRRLRPRLPRAVVETLGRPSINCTIRNMSEGGAFVEPVDQVFLPQVFGLRVGSPGRLIDCEVIHRSGRACGVVFRYQAGLTGDAARRAVRGALI